MCKITNNFTVEQLNEIFEYKNGNLHFRESGRGRKDPSIPAGSRDSGGYCKVTMKQGTFYNHRLTFYICHGYLPKFIDHIDGDLSDNSIENLRKVTHQQNMQNKKSRKGSSSKYLGVYNNKGVKRPWTAQIRTERLGSFSCEEDAAIAYNVAAKRYYGEYASLSSPL